jgi:hypothetical protein
MGTSSPSELGARPDVSTIAERRAGRRGSRGSWPPVGLRPLIMSSRSSNLSIHLHKRAVSSAGERFVHTEEVAGSIPAPPTEI